jgi:hypothetical protein
VLNVVIADQPEKTALSKHSQVIVDRSIPEVQDES